MPQAIPETQSIFGIHDPGGETHMADMGRRGWIVFLEELGSGTFRGRDYSQWSGQGFGVICRLNYGYGSTGTIPYPDEYEMFAKFVADYVGGCSGCSIWIIGNEMNHSQEWPQSHNAVQPQASVRDPAKPLPAAMPLPAITALEPIVPDLYARCFKLCRDAIHALSGHDQDLVVVGAVAPWTNEAQYPGNEKADWIKYFADILRLLGAGGCDGMALHAYTHGSDPKLVTDTTVMTGDFAGRFYNFLAYRDFMNAIPPDMRQLPVYVTEASPTDTWPDQPNGWIQAAYAEIDRWNQDPGHQQIHAMVLYRWQSIDKWHFGDKEAAIADFRDAMRNDYRWRSTVSSAQAGSPSMSPSPGYISDFVDASGDNLRDQMEIDREVLTIAHVLMSPLVKPPLSLGLFGDWGSGKTFFMVSLQKRIGQLVAAYRQQERQTGERSEWCTRIVQITFNAWHFSDANLWASIVTRIYEELDRALKPGAPSDEDLRKSMAQRVQTAESMVAQTKIETELAKDRVAKAERKLREAQEDLARKNDSVHELIGDVGALLGKDSELHASLQSAAKALGYPQAAESYEALLGLYENLQTIAGRGSALAVSLVRAPWTILVLAALVIGLPILVTWSLAQFAVPIGEIGRTIAQISTVIVAIVAWLQQQVGKGLGLIAMVEKALSDAESVRAQRLSQDELVQGRRQELVEAEAKEQAARETFEAAKLNLQRLERELQELQPERKLFHLIEERSQSETYSKHLGIVSLIRSDFEQISKLLDDMCKSTYDPVAQEPPIQRIVLYIDDLDRCRPERVVQVLEAIHLLLAFPLFVVVVAVDPRWLRHSLADHYTETLRENGRPHSDDQIASSAFYSTPQNYLEKIFQIPFAVRPLDQFGFQKLVTGLMEPMPEPAPYAVGLPAPHSGSSPTPQGQQGAGTKAPGGTVLPATLVGANASAAQTDGRTAEAEGSLARWLTLNHDQLRFETWEEQGMLRLWPLFRTPRSAKRFVNIYRLLRAGLSPGDETARFVGTSQQGGEYRLVQVLLAVVAAWPNEAERFLAGVEASVVSRVAGKHGSDWRFQDFLAMPAVQHASSYGVQAIKSGSARTAKKHGGPASIALVAHDDPWDDLLEHVREVTAADAGQPYPPEAVERWLARVGRYSFTVRLLD